MAANLIERVRGLLTAPEFQSAPERSLDFNQPLVRERLLALQDLVLSPLDGPRALPTIFCQFFSKIRPLQPTTEGQFSGSPEKAVFLDVVAKCIVKASKMGSAGRLADLAAYTCNFCADFFGLYQEAVETGQLQLPPGLLSCLNIVSHRHTYSKLSLASFQKVEAEWVVGSRIQFDQVSVPVLLTLFSAIKSIRWAWVANQAKQFFDIDEIDPLRLRLLSEGWFDFQVALMTYPPVTEVVRGGSPDGILKNALEHFSLVAMTAAKGSAMDNSGHPHDLVAPTSFQSPRDRHAPPIFPQPPASHHPDLGKIVRKIEQFIHKIPIPDATLRYFSSLYLHVCQAAQDREGCVGIPALTLIDICTRNYECTFVRAIFNSEFQSALVIRLFQAIKAVGFKGPSNLPERLFDLCNNFYFKKKTVLSSYVHRKTLEWVSGVTEADLAEKRVDFDAVCLVERVCEILVENQNSFVLVAFLRANKNPAFQKTARDALLKIIGELYPTPPTSYRDFKEKMANLELKIFLEKKSLGEAEGSLQRDLDQMHQWLMEGRLTLCQRLNLESEFLFKRLFLNLEKNGHSTRVALPMVLNFLEQAKKLAHRFRDQKELGLAAKFMAEAGSVEEVLAREAGNLVTAVAKFDLEEVAYFYFALENFIFFDKLYEAKSDCTAFFDAMLLISHGKGFCQQMLDWVLVRALQETSIHFSDKAIQEVKAMAIRARDRCHEGSEIAYLDICLITELSRVVRKRCPPSSLATQQTLATLQQAIGGCLSKVSSKISRSHPQRYYYFVLLRLNVDLVSRTSNFVATAKILKEINYLFHALWRKEARNDSFFELVRLEHFSSNASTFKFYDEKTMLSSLPDLIVHSSLLTVLESLREHVKTAFEGGIYSCIMKLVETYRTVAANCGLTTHYLRALEMEVAVTRQRPKVEGWLDYLFDSAQETPHSTVVEFDSANKNAHPRLRQVLLKLVIDVAFYCEKFNSLTECFPTQKKQKIDAVLGKESSKRTFRTQVLENFGVLVERHIGCPTVRRHLAFDKGEPQFDLLTDHRFGHLLSVLRGFLTAVGHGCRRTRVILLEKIVVSALVSYKKAMSCSEFKEIEVVLSFENLFKAFFVVAFGLNFITLAKDILSVVFSVRGTARGFLRHTKMADPKSRSRNRTDECGCPVEMDDRPVTFEYTMTRFINHEQLFRYIYKKAFLVEKRTSFVFRKSINRRTVALDTPVADFRANSVLLLAYLAPETASLLWQDNFELLDDNEVEKKGFFYFLGAFETLEKVTAKGVYYGHVSLDHPTLSFWDVSDKPSLFVI